MNPIFLAIFFASAASATIVFTTTTAATALTATQAGSLIAGIGLVKAVAVGALALGAAAGLAKKRGRRDAEDTSFAKEVRNSMCLLFVQC